jgi:UDP-N-acetylglucosamine transferase subunit ALG13
VVVNKDLMDNHQTELTATMEAGNYLFSADVDNVLQVTRECNLRDLKQYPSADKFAFPALVDSVMGVRKAE